jgi:hypothetical protein
MLQAIDAERVHWQGLTAEVGLERMEEPGPMGDWTFKDLTAHLTGWRERTIDRIEAGSGVDPPTPWPAQLTTDDEINGWIYTRNRDRPLRDVLSAHDQSFVRLADAIAALPDEDLLAPGRFEWLGGEALVDVELFGHLHEEHEPSIRAWLAAG